MCVTEGECEDEGVAGVAKPIHKARCYEKAEEEE